MFKKLLRIVIIVCIVAGAVLLGLYFKSQHDEKVKKEKREAIEEQEREAEEERKKQEEKAAEEEKKRQEQAALEEELKKQEEAAKEAEKKRQEKIEMTQKMSGEWRLASIYSFEENEWIDSADESWINKGVGLLSEFLQMQDNTTDKIAGYLVDELLVCEAVYISIDNSGVNLNGIGDGVYLFSDGAIGSESYADGKTYYVNWVDSKGDVLYVAYDHDFAPYKNSILLSFYNEKNLHNDAFIQYCFVRK